MKKICIIPLVLCTLHFLSCSTGVEEDQNKSGSNAAIEEQSFITYSFYSDNSSSQAWITISGKTGEPVPHVSVPKKTNYRFNEWKSADGEAVPYIFGEKDLDFYAEWKLLEGINRGNLLGSKTTPDALYDLVFSDGSAMPYPDQLDSLTSEQLSNVVAMIYTTTYNPNTGSNTTGNFKLGAGFLQKDLKWCSKSYLKDNRIGFNEPRVLVYNLMYTGYVFEDTDNDPKKTHAIKSLNPNYGLANYYDSPMFEQYVDFEFAPAFYYATNYGYYKNIVEVYRKKWYLPSIEEIRALFKNEEARQKYMQLSLKVTSVLLDNVSIWTNSTDDKQTPIEVNSGEWYSNQSGNGRNFDDKCIVRFPGELNRIKINVKDKDLGAWPGTNVHRYDIYYLFYSKAYCIDYKGNQGLKEKDEGACVIPIRIF